MSAEDHCQGCGLVEGEPRVTWHNRKNPNANGGWDYVRKVGARCVLRPLDLGGLGERQFCQRCWHLALLENTRLECPQLTPKKKGDRRPDPRQLRF